MIIIIHEQSVLYKVIINCTLIIVCIIFIYKSKVSYFIDFVVNFRILFFENNLVFFLRKFFIPGSSIKKN